MLSVLMAQPPSFPIHTTAPVAANTMSLAILPSAPMAYSSPSMPSLTGAASPSPSKRPKLSLNTSNAAAPTVFGKGSTSLRLEALSATSPTTKNTWKNTYGQRRTVRRPTLRSPRIQKSPATKHIVNHLSPTTTADHLSPVESTEASPSSSPATSTSTTESSPAEIPYKLSFNVSSILKNTPLSHASTRKRHSRQMFPAAKKVDFREPLTENITTTKYTLRHSDIESSTSTISTLELSPPEDRSGTDQSEPNRDQAPDSSKETKDVSSPQCGDKRDSSDDDDSDNCPATPTVGRKKRHRQWVWTLGPIEPEAQQENEKQAQVEQEVIEPS